MLHSPDALLHSACLDSPLCEVVLGEKGAWQPLVDLVGNQLLARLSQILTDLAGGVHRVTPVHVSVGNQKHLSLVNTPAGDDGAIANLGGRHHSYQCVGTCLEEGQVWIGLPH